MLPILGHILICLLSQLSSRLWALSTFLQGRRIEIPIGMHALLQTRQFPINHRGAVLPLTRALSVQVKFDVHIQNFILIFERLHEPCLSPIFDATFKDIFMHFNYQSSNPKNSVLQGQGLSLYTVYITVHIHYLVLSLFHACGFSAARLACGHLWMMNRLHTCADPPRIVSHLIIASTFLYKNALSMSWILYIKLYIEELVDICINIAWTSSCILVPHL